MNQKATRAVFMRGGTSKAIVFRSADLPPGRAAWAKLFLAAMGSPDPYGRQLDGMGGGVTSLSKVCVVGAPTRSDADVDYTFAQVLIDRAEIDYASNCGNMSSAIGPFAVDEKMVEVPANGEAVVRIHNTNTGRIIVARFPVRDGRATVTGELSIDGVSGTGAPIRLDFMDPAGSRTGVLLPTGNIVDTVMVLGSGPLRVGLVDAANPCVLVAANDLGLNGTETPDDIERNTSLMDRLESLRQVAALTMGLASDWAEAARVVSIPKVAMLAPPADTILLSGCPMKADQADILVRVISSGQPHRAVPLTAALCIAVACKIPGSIPNILAKVGDPTSSIRIGHPSGTMLVTAKVAREGASYVVPYATIFRTARRLFQGEVMHPVRNV